MDASVLFLIGTLALWIGGYQVLRGVFLALRAFLIEPALVRPGVLNKAAIAAGSGAILMLISLGIPKDLGRKVEATQWIPLVWVYTPIAGWMILISVFMVIAKLIQWRTALTPEEAVEKLKQLGAWAVVGILGFVWLNHMKWEIDILRGALPFNPTGLTAFVVLALATVWIMVMADRFVKSRGAATKLATHAVLLVGCFVFGVPFAWMLSTSFKEERDIANSDGLVWIPKVQFTHPFDDPERPYVEAIYDGRPVRALVDSELGDGRLLLDIERPYALRGRRFEVRKEDTKKLLRDQFVWETTLEGGEFTKPVVQPNGRLAATDNRRVVVAFTVRDQEDGSRLLRVLDKVPLTGEVQPEAGREFTRKPEEVQPHRRQGLRWENYTDAMEWMPLEANYGLRYLQNTLTMVIMSVIGTVISCALVAYGFSRLRFPGRNQLFSVMLATMMLPGAVTMLPSFLIFRQLGWIDTLLPLWVPAFFAGAFNVFLLRQFFSTIPMELEEAARIDGCSYFRTFWQVMLPQVKPALAAISIWTFMGAWNNFMGPLIYISSPENMPLAYALQLFSGDRGTDAQLMMAFATMTVMPVVLLFFFAQRYFIEGVQLSGLGGR